MSVLAFQQKNHYPLAKMVDNDKWSDLHQAVKSGVHGGLPYSRTQSLLEAIIAHDTSHIQLQQLVFQQLLTHSVVQNPNHPTLLSQAVLAGRSDFVADLLHAGFSPHEKLMGHHAASCLALRHGKQDYTHVSWDALRQQPVHQWTEEDRNRLAAVGVLCANGFNIDQPLDNSSTALVLALLAKDNACVHYFLSCGANPNHTSGHPLYGLPPLEIALRTANTEAVASLVYFGAHWDNPMVLEWAAQYGDGAMLDVFEKRITDRALWDKAWRAALEVGNPHTVAWFLQHGCRAEKDNSSSLRIAATSGNEQTLQLLISAGASPEAVGAHGQNTWDLLKHHFPCRAYYFNLPRAENKVVALRRR